MAKRTVSQLLERRSARLRLTIVLLFAGMISLQAVVFVLVIGLGWGESVEAWLPELLISSAFLLAGGVLVLIIITRQQRKTSRQVGQAANRELRALTLARNRTGALKALSAAIGSTRSVEGLFDVTLDVYQLALNDLGVPPEDQANAIFLLDDGHLVAVAARGSAVRGLAELEEDARLDRHQGIIGRALAQAELSISDRPDQDPLLAGISWLEERQQVICVPLCTTHGLYGLVMLALKEPLSLAADDAGLMEAIADQVAMALYNFQTRQNLDLTRISFLMAEEDERRLLRRSLHEGPSRRVAAVALRLGLIRTMMIRDAAQATKELSKVETQTRQSSQELRNMVSLLRPLALDVKDLNRAVESTVHKIEDGLNLEIQLSQQASGALLSEQARAVSLYVLEGTLTWAKKEGQATAAEILLRQEGDLFLLSINDNGSAQVAGKSAAAVRAGDLAFALMRAKVRRVGGQLDITAKPGRGVSTLLSMPAGEQGHAPVA